MQPRTELRLPAESIAPALARAGVRGMSVGGFPHHAASMEIRQNRPPE